MMRLDRMIYNPKVDQVQAEAATQIFDYLGNKIKKIAKYFKTKKEQRRKEKVLKLVKSIGAVKKGDTELKSAMDVEMIKAVKRGALTLFIKKK